MSAYTKDFVDGYVGSKMKLVDKYTYNSKINFRDPRPRTMFNPLGIYRKMDLTPNNVKAINLTHGIDPAQNINVTDNVTNAIETFKETTIEIDDTEELLLDTYMCSLRERAKAVNSFCLQSKAYAPWKSNWEFLRKNLMKKNKLNFELLDASDQDIAYVVDKGVNVCFRIRDKERFLPINIYQYVLYHEMAHMSTTDHQHTVFFHKLLNLLSLAAYELGLIDLTRMTKNVYTTNGQGIASAASIKDEILTGCDHMLEVHANDAKLVKYYQDLKAHVSKQ